MYIYITYILHIYVYVYVMKLIRGQFLNKVPANVLIILAFLIHVLAPLSSDEGLTRCLSNQVQLRDTIQTTSE